MGIKTSCLGKPQPKDLDRSSSLSLVWQLLGFVRQKTTTGIKAASRRYNIRREHGEGNK